MALLIVLAAGPPIEAQESPDAPAGDSSLAAFAVQPSGPDGPGGRDHFVYTLSPGETFGDTVAVSNLSDRPINFRIYPADALNVPGEGGFTAARDGEPSTDVGSWVTLKGETYTVQPGKRIDVPFSITIPEDAVPGDHAGAILATDVDTGQIDPNSENSNLSVRERVGARMYVRVDGPITPDIRIDRLDVASKSPSFAVPFFSNDGEAIVDWEITNTGNTRLTPTAVIKVEGLFGRTIQTLPAQELPEILPGSNLVRANLVTDLPALEKITIELTITAEGVETVGTSSYWAVPWLFVLLVAALVLGVLGWRRWRRRQLPDGDAPGPSATREKVHV